MRWRLILAISMALLMAIAFGSAVSADGGPHGGYRDVSGGLPDQCAACHRVHQGQSTGKLLKADSPYALCLTCHNGAGSQLDVLDGVKLGSLISPDAGVIRAADAVDMTVSVAPTADLSTGAGGSTEFTIAVRNRSAAAITANLTISAETNAVDFAASGLSAASLNVPAAVANIPGVSYATLTTTSNAAAAIGVQNLTTVQASYDPDGAGPQPPVTATLRAQTRVGSVVADGIDDGPAVGGTNDDQFASNTLNGGGFRYINGLSITSRHNADPADNSLRPWGFNSNTGQDTNTLASPLQCTSCHNPHGTSNYRLLKETINGSNVVVRAFFSSAFTKDEGARGLEAGAPADKYTKEYYGSSGGGGAPANPADPANGNSISSLCGACHTAYPSSGAAVAYNAGGVTHYRHKTEMPYTDWTNPETGLNPNNPETSGLAGFPALRLASNGAQTNTIVSCLTCHRVHGSASSMTGYALMQQFGGISDNDLTPSQTATSKSTLLWTDNRGMCEACHQW